MLYEEISVHMLITLTGGIFFSFPITAMATEASATYDAIINLGGDCQPQHQMKINHLRKYALPFDHLVTPVESLLKILEQRFELFLEKETLAFKVTEKEKYIEDTRYGIRMIHDFSLTEDFLKDYEEIKAKYTRRIHRFHDILQSSQKVLFIRKRITKEQVVLLDLLIRKLYPKLEFLIVALDGSKECQEDWQIPHVRNFHLRQPEPYIWTGDDIAWKEIFEQLDLDMMKFTDALDDYC